VVDKTDPKRLCHQCAPWKLRRAQFSGDRPYEFTTTDETSTEIFGLGDVKGKKLLGRLALLLLRWSGYISGISFEIFAN
jgi:hypothetical protein